MSKVIEAIKKIYPTCRGCAYWETQPDGTPWVNPIDGLVWENAEFEKPTWEQIEAEFPSVDLDQAKSVRVATRLKYLEETDWQAAAFTKYGRPIDSGVAEKCQLAATEMQVINACTTLEEVEQYSINF